jgi:hypothetical protein
MTLADAAAQADALANDGSGVGSTEPPDSDRPALPAGERK